MGAYRGLLNQMLRKVEVVHNAPRSTLRRKLGEARRDEAGLFNHLWGARERSTGLRSFEAREAAEEAHEVHGAPLYEHAYHPTKGWRIYRV